MHIVFIILFYIKNLHSYLLVKVYFQFNNTNFKGIADPQGQAIHVELKIALSKVFIINKTSFKPSLFIIYNIIFSYLYLFN